MQGTWRMPTTRGTMWSLYTVLSTILLSSHVSLQTLQHHCLYRDQRLEVWPLKVRTLMLVDIFKRQLHHFHMMQFQSSKFTQFSIQLVYKGTYNNWCSEFTKRHHNWVYLGLGRLKVGIVFGLKDWEAWSIVRTCIILEEFNKKNINNMWLWFFISNLGWSLKVIKAH